VPVLRRICLLLVAALALVVGPGVAPAAAHVELASATPADGSVLTSAPASLSLTFSTTPVSVGVDVTGPDGAAVAVGELQRQGATVVLPLPALDEPGAYTVSWQAANDEHPFTGSYTVTLDLPATTTTTSAVAPTDSLPAGSSGSDDQSGGATTAAVAVSAVAIAAAIGIAVAARLRRRRKKAGPTLVGG
jgi:copper resistance protein C